jgi:hypothetical protein
VRVGRAVPGCPVPDGPGVSRAPAVAPEGPGASGVPVVTPVAVGGRGAAELPSPAPQALSRAGSAHALTIAVSRRFE